MIVLLALFSCASNQNVECPSAKNQVQSLPMKPLLSIGKRLFSKSHWPIYELDSPIWRGFIRHLPRHPKVKEFIGKDPGTSGKGTTWSTLSSAFQSWEQWQADFSLQCDTTRENGTIQPYEYSRTYSVSYSGPNAGTGLPNGSGPVPNAAGKRECNYSLTPYDPGEKSFPQ